MFYVCCRAAEALVICKPRIEYLQQRRVGIPTMMVIDLGVLRFSIRLLFLLRYPARSFLEPNTCHLSCSDNLCWRLQQPCLFPVTSVHTLCSVQARFANFNERTIFLTTASELPLLENPSLTGISTYISFEVCLNGQFERI